MLEVGNGKMTNTEYQAHFALWALMNAPLLAGNDLRSMSDATKKILTNRDIIALDQDWAGKQGYKLRDDGDTEVWTKPMSDGSAAVVLLNRGLAAAPMSATTAELGLGKARDFRVRDLWTGTETETTGTLRASVPSHGAAVFRVWPARFPAAAPLSTLTVQAPDFADTAKPFTTTVRLTNDGSTPLVATQVKLAAPAGWRLDGRADVLVPLVAPGRSWQRTWTVRPVSPSGDRVTLSASATYWTAWGERSLTADGGAPIVSPPAPGVTALSKAAWLSAENGYGPVERGTSNGEAKAGDGHRITIGGVPYDDGLGVHAPSRVRFYLGGGCTAFGASVGHDDEKPKGSVAFQVLGDGKELAETGVMTAGLPAQQLAADLTGVQVLDLVVTDGGDGTDSDHADWADATITC